MLERRQLCDFMSHRDTAEARQRRRRTTTRNNDEEEGENWAGQVVLPPPGPQVRVHHLGLAWLTSHIQSPARLPSTFPDQR